MKLLKWMQNKFNGGQCNQVPKVVDPVPVPASYHTRRLLTIGTLGNQTLPGNQELRRRSVVNPQTVTSNEEEEGSLSPDLTEFTPEEIGKLQKNLTKLLKRKTPASASEIQNADVHQQQPLDRFLNCPSNLTIDRTVSSRYSTNSSNTADELEEEIDRTIRVIIGRCNEVCMENKKKKGIFGKKSVSFLVKKMLLCSGGFGGPPITIRQFMQESRMEKLLRTLMLSKKICLQNASRASSTKRILEGTHSTNTEKQDDETQEEQEKRVERRKWVKTDSDCTMNFSF